MKKGDIDKDGELEWGTAGDLGNVATKIIGSTILSMVSTTSLGHILGQLMMDHTAGMMMAAHAKLEWATAIAAVIEWFAGPILEELNQNDIHQAENTFMDNRRPACYIQ
ncbi:hypothetical protein EDD18DRAFT_1111981 [Armillaria luteobubalina]|uniref:Uncharacterized protein n=1 Tax=Armillaria luteobubalina TaxID=153913 RepID=A0AA39TEL6_9AGAR|nr:hypothetical protein EDD18DRAFT_1111981 [Armillaria luteobubalina]